jgi:phage shock protein PspC (stress-responsive transcriptional regulator)
MKKTVTANISGIVFHIDEDAYEKLNLYLARVRQKLSPDIGADEVLSDIEARIAEMFNSRLSNNKKVITIDDVRYVTEQLGEPEQFEETEEPKARYESYRSEKSDKRLYRDPDDQYIGGVAGGLGAFFNVDPTWIRVAFVLFTLVYGFGPLLYIILWIVVPKARTTAEKLEMRGEKVNLSNIEKSIREELNDLKKNIKEFSEETKEHFKKKNQPVRDHNARIAAGFIRVFAKVAGIILIIMSFAFIIAIISGIYLLPVGIHHAHGVWLHSLPDMLSAVLTSEVWIRSVLIALMLVVGLPIFWMLLVGVQLLFEIKATSKYVGAVTFILWLAAIGTISLATVSGVRNFTGEYTTGNEYILEETQWPNLYIKLDESKINDASVARKHGKFTTWQMLWQESNSYAIGMPRLRIKESAGNLTKLEVTRESRGSSPYEASLNASAIEYTFVQKDSLLILDPVFTFDKNHGWRNQQITLELSLPKEKIAVLDKNLKRNISVNWSRDIRVIEE